MACHNLTPFKDPVPSYSKLLGLGLTFCPRPRFTSGKKDVKTIMARLRKDIYTKCHYASLNPEPFDQKMLYVRSTKMPPLRTIPIELKARLQAFENELKKLFHRRRSPSNLLGCQRLALKRIKTHSNLIVAKTDKNLGPALIERETFIQRAFNDHLHDIQTYKPLTAYQAEHEASVAAKKVTNFLRNRQKHITASDRKFIQASMSAAQQSGTVFPQFTITLKLHKDPMTTRPIVAVSGTQLHGLGRWVDQELQPIGRATKAFISSSWQLAQLFPTLPAFPPTAKLVTADAVSMYTNIDTRHAAKVIGRLVPPHVLEGALLVMQHNVFQFGNTHWIQKNGTAMGVPPACMWATLYFARREARLMDDYKEYLLFFRRFIDDCFFIWNFTGTADCIAQYKLFKKETRIGKLRWTFTEPSNKAVFLDMTITLSEGRLSTRLYEKALNLYLYLPPHSAHPPGVLRGLITGMIMRIFRLTSDRSLCQSDLQAFYDRLIARGYNRNIIAPLFQAAISKFRHSDLTPAPQDQLSFAKTIFLHVPYHPLDPQSTDLQKVFRRFLLDNRWEDRTATPLPEIRNSLGVPLGVERMIVAYHRPRNINNLLSPRHIDRTPGPSVSAEREHLLLQRRRASSNNNNNNNNNNTNNNNNSTRMV